MRKKSQCFGVEKETTCRKRRDGQPTNSRDRKAPHHRIFVGRHELTQPAIGPRAKGRYALSLKLDDPSFTATICAKLIEETKLRGTIRRA